MDGASLTSEQEKLNALKQVLPEVFAEGKVDWEKLKATLGEDINFSNERYVLNWAGKSEAFKVLQAPTTKTLVPAKDESVNFEDTEHIFIEGENLEVLKVLQKSYFGKVKMIYIDPPYNTGNDSFIYPDKFSETKEEYAKRVGDKDEEGYMTKDGMFKKNSKENGQYHSNWLNMMMPRLYLAKNLLKQDGVIFISIDDNEVHNLRLMMNEIFGEENFVAELVWQKKTGSSDAKHIATITESILVFAKQVLSLNLNQDEKAHDEKRYKYKDEYYDERGSFYYDNLDRGTLGYIESLDYGVKAPNGKEVFPNGRNKQLNDGWRWKWGKEKLEWGLKNGFIEVQKSTSKECGWGVYYKIYLNVDNEGKKSKRSSPYKNIIQGILNTHASSETKELFGNPGVFSNPKPTNLIKKLLLIGSQRNDLIIDFFSGSGTTAHSVMSLNVEDGGNRRCISVQLSEYCDEKSDAYKAGFKNIADIAKERIRRASSKIKQDIGLKISELEKQIKTLQSEIQTEETKSEIENFKSKIEQHKNQDLGFKVLILSDSNFKQWQQIKGKDKKALEEQMQLFIDPVTKNATTENMVYELLLKSGQNLNCKIEDKNGFYAINDTELVFLLEQANQKIIDTIIARKPKKVIALDKLFKGNDQLKTNASLQMKDAGIEFKPI